MAKDMLRKVLLKGKREIATARALFAVELLLYIAMTSAIYGEVLIISKLIRQRAFIGFCSNYGY